MQFCNASLLNGLNLVKSDASASTLGILFICLDLQYSHPELLSPLRLPISPSRLAIILAYQSVSSSADSPLCPVPLLSFT